MTVQELTKRNERFQQHAAELTEIMTNGRLLEHTTKLIRGGQRLEMLLGKLLKASKETRFMMVIGVLEEEMDEMIFILDLMDVANRSPKIEVITSLVKEGYELLSLYSLCCDQIIKSQIKEDEF